MYMYIFYIHILVYTCTYICVYIYIDIHDAQYYYILRPWRFPLFQGQGSRTLGPTSSHAMEHEQHQIVALQRRGVETFDNPPRFYVLIHPEKCFFTSVTREFF